MMSIFAQESIKGSFWCSGGSGQPWTWDYNPLVGVWIVALLGVLARLYFLRNVEPLSGPKPKISNKYHIRFGVATFFFVVVTEWPLGQIGAGYLLTAAAIRWIVLNMIVCPLALTSIPWWAYEAVFCATPLRKKISYQLTRWQVAFGVSTAIMWLTHYAPIVDSLGKYQAGNFLTDIAWLVGSTWFWWPVLSDSDLLPGVRDPFQGLYLFASSMAGLVPAVILTYAKLPLYSLYELAPPIWIGYDVLSDQRGAGVLLNISMILVYWPIITWYFMTWANRKDRLDRGLATEKDVIKEAKQASHHIK